MSSIVNNFTLGLNQNLDVPVGVDYTNLVVTPGFNNIMDAGGINGFTVAAVAQPVDFTIAITGTLTDGTIQDTNIDEVQMFNYGGTSLVVVGNNGILNAENGSTNTNDTAASGGFVNAYTGASISGLDVKAGGLFENGGAAVSSTTLEAGSSFSLILGTDTHDLVEMGATAAQSGGINSDPTVYGTLNITNEFGATLDGAQIKGGDISIDSGTLSNTINFSGTGGILQIGSAATILPGTEITGFAAGDTIELMGADSVSYNSATGMLTFGDPSALELPLSSGQTLVSAAISGGEEVTVTGEATPCFLPGTHIRTPDGDVKIEELRIGDMIATASGPKPIKWIGTREYDGRFIAGNHLALPIHIEKNAIAEGVPARDLNVSPGHGIFIDGALVPAWRLVNGQNITQAKSVDSVRYLNIETAGHDVMYAEGCPTETFLEIPGAGFRNQFQNVAEYHKLYPEAATDKQALPRVEEGFQLAKVQHIINAFAGIKPPVENKNDTLHGFVDSIGNGVVSGWAQCIESPETPVTLHVVYFIGATPHMDTVIANQYRDDLRKAGLGSGTHGFTHNLPEGARNIGVRRAVDHAQSLPHTEAAQQAAFAQNNAPASFANAQSAVVAPKKQARAKPAGGVARSRAAARSANRVTAQQAKFA